MNDRSIFMNRLVHFTLARNVTKFFLILSDLAGAILSAWLASLWMPPLLSINHIPQIWLLSVIVFWLITYDLDKSFNLDSYLTYTRVIKVIFWAALGYLLFFMLTRNMYSLRFLLKASLLWMTIAMSARWLLDKFSPLARGLAFEKLPDVLLSNNKIIWEFAAQPKDINLSKYDFLMIDFSKQYSSDCQELFTHAHVVGLPILTVPQVVEHTTGKISIEHLTDHWVEATFYIDPFYLRVKRVFDIVLTLLLAPILLTLGLIIALAILITMGRPIFYWQQRVGLNDKFFKMVKFRTMVVDAEKIGAASTAKGDVRVTGLGSLLRKLRLDELPQFYNVLIGDMSIIGPRPEYAVLVEDYIKNIPLFQIRHWLRPGITGWAQVMHGYASDQDEMKEKIRYDMFYLKNLSFWLDMLIIFRTAIIVLTGFGSR